MTDIEKALACYDGDNSLPYCDLVYRALKELQKREKGCEICSGNYTIQCHTAHERAEDYIPTNYCPNCGRKLEE